LIAQGRSENTVLTKRKRLWPTDHVAARPVPFFAAHRHAGTAVVVHRAAQLDIAEQTDKE